MALVTIRRSPSVQTPRKSDEAEKPSDSFEDDVGNQTSRSLNECYFANKGAALVLGASERGCADQRRSPARAHPQPDIQHHLQSMFYLLRPEETLKMAVKLESAHAGRTRYLVVVCRSDEAALLGMDCNEGTTVGLVLRVMADTAIKLDGDGGFSVCVCNQQHIFKPVSVQAMWSALQTLHRASGRARERNHFAGGPSHAWCAHYEARVDSDRSCLNEWHAMDCIESRRPPSPDSLRVKPRERDETERVIRCTLKEIMMSVDLDEVTSKAIRGRLEADLDMDLAEYKSFIDQEMLTILGQMDAPTEIFDHVFLGSEWNASNLEELQRNGVRHILNVTREIDNFFPGMFDYLNVRVYDDDKTDLLKHWDNTFKYINKAKNEGSKVLVHCKMGISRSASVVIAYAMKAFNWNFERALKHVKTKRSCIKPNTNFLNQLETYQGILDAMKNKEKLQRSKSETNLKSPKAMSRAERAARGGGAGAARRARGRPRSWAPGAAPPASPPPPTSLSLESLASETRHMLMPCAGGCYSVSPNQIIRLKGEGAPSVRHIVKEIEKSGDRKDFNRRSQRLNFGSPSESVNRSSDPTPCSQAEPTGRPPQASPSRNPLHKYPLASCEAERIHTWDPGEPRSREDEGRIISANSYSDNIGNSDSDILDGKTKHSEAYTNSADGAAGGEETAAEGLAAPRAAPDPGDVSERSISDNERKFNETCAILKVLAGAAARERGAWSGRLSASAPADTWLRAAPRRRRLHAASHGDLPRAPAASPPSPASSPPSPAGHVSNLKKEFEARSEAEAGRAARRETARVERGALAGEAARVERGPLGGEAARVERGALGGEAARVERGALGGEAARVERGALGGEAARTERGPSGGAARTDRPPPAPTVLALAPLDYPNVVVSTVMSKAQNKKQVQHGKTHPLTRLSLNRSNNRCTNPVYNTM